MQNLLNEFKELVGPFHEESGNIRRRTSWTKLCGLASKLANEINPVLTHLNQEDSLALCLAASSAGEKRNSSLIAMFNQCLEYNPTDNFINLLSQLTGEEMNNTLLPFIYEPGNKSSNAVYLAAKLGIIIKAEVFKTFLGTHQWSRGDLINLSLLIIPEEKEHLLSLLEQSISTCESVVEKTAYATFKYILETNESNLPLFPELVDVAPPKPAALPEYVAATTQTPTVSATASTPQATFVKAPTLDGAATEQKGKKTAQHNSIKKEQKKVAKTQAQIRENIFVNQIKVFKSPVLKSTFKDYIDNYAIPISIGAGLIFLLFFGLIIFNLMSDDAPEKITAGVPSSWTDAATNVKITQDYLAADVDYRVGELYLTRNYYEDALKMFEYALRRDKTHLLALIRKGNCNYYLKNYDVALKTFQQALTQAPKAQFINLYIARIYRDQKDFKEAIKYYNREMKLEMRVDIGVEYATFLKSIGENNKSMEVLHDLQQMFPDKAIVLTSTSENEGGTL